MSKYVMVLGFEDTSDRICEPTGGIIDIDRTPNNKEESNVLTAVALAMIDPHKMSSMPWSSLNTFECLKEPYPFNGCIEDEITLYFEQ